MSYPFSVRPAIPADKAAVSAVAEAAMPGDWVPYVYDEIMKTPPPAGLYVAEQDGRIFACYELMLSGPGEAFFSAMRVDPAMQGQGIGTRFCEAQIEQARSQGVRSIYLLSALGNVRAHRTVAKNGFVNRGAWTLYYDLKLPDSPAEPVRARRATPDDRALVQRFLAEHAGEPLADVICSWNSPWQTKTLTPSDWDDGELVVVAGPHGLEGLMLLSIDTWKQLVMRRLEGTAEAVADLLAYAMAWARRQGCEEWAVSLPARLEHLVKPLELPEEKCYRAYVFHHTAEAPRHD